MAEVERVRAGDPARGDGEVYIPPRALHWLNLPVTSDLRPLGRLLVFRDVTEERVLAKMRDDLSRTMVHDLRNPLTAISLSLQLLEMQVGESASPDARQALESARNGAQRMLVLINNILDVSRLESRQMPLERELVSLAGLVAEMVITQSPLAADKDLYLESDAPPNLPPARVDAGMMRRGLQNRVDNDIKFTPAGGLLRVAVELVATGGNEPPRLRGCVARGVRGHARQLTGQLCVE